MRLLVHVEGETEETFINEVLGLHLWSQGYSIRWSDKTDGYRKDGPIAVAWFECMGPEQREAQLLRQCQASDMVEQLLAKIDGRNCGG